MKKLFYILMVCICLTGCRNKEPDLTDNGEKISRNGEKISQEQEISKEVLRFHIRAVSDREEDQQLKQKVKTQVLSYLQWLLAGCSSKENCMKIIEKNLGQIEKVTTAACKAEGKSPKTRAYLTREVFPLKQYGDMVFPSGVYDALRIDLGKAEGKNWWCMMYPSLCMVDGVVEEVPKESKKELKENLSPQAYESLFWTQTGQKEGGISLKSTDETKYHVKWRIMESFQQYFGKK